MSSTIRDVARHAGVSISTVSRVLNDTSPVAEEKRRLVLEAVDALEYAPNPAARSLLGKRTGGLGVLLPFVNGEFFSELLSGMDEAAQERGCFLVISTSHRQSDEFRRAAQALDKRVDGLVVMAPEIDAAGAASILATDVPVVFLNTHAEPGLEADVINFDNYGGAYTLTRRLIEAGHRRIAHVLGPPNAWDARERSRGYREAMQEAGLASGGLECSGGYTREAGYAATEELLQSENRPTAIVAANDYCALGAVSALHEAGVAVPEDVAVCGFDGLPSTKYTVPPLTTVRVPIHEIGAKAIRRLLARVEDADNSSYQHETVSVEAVVRASTG